MQTEKEIILCRHFEEFIPLSESLRKELLDRIECKEFRKGELIHESHKICTTSYFIEKGLVRSFFLKDGKEITEFFCCENEWVNSPKSFMQRKVDIYAIDAIEDTKVFCLDIKDLGYLFDHFPEMERYARLSMGTILGHLLERITILRFTTAKEKYEHFCEVYKDVYHRIPLGMMASYLGIAQETLSRIRK
ncbi:Crp/Fnr family transcriptional regulator [Flavobacterium sp. J27]|uniref:Crp/Fnr family transcriptional regulator n=1 Tax=Flavobacterium sp. J27 TaxID=2060419 RepID=UPI00102FAA34|nr:Crp/Fnr family transcriptional regulator [Flavobacterium sp. J27]